MSYSRFVFDNYMDVIMYLDQHNKNSWGDIWRHLKFKKIRKQRLVENSNKGLYLSCSDKVFQEFIDNRLIESKSSHIWIYTPTKKFLTFVDTMNNI